jgi:hypothetical protein
MATSEQDLMEAKRSIAKMLSRIPNRSESSFSTSYSVDIDELLSRLPNREDLSRNDNKFVRDWKESDHPRDKDGKFASEGGLEAKNEAKTISEILGKEYKNYNGQSAIDVIYENRGGYVANAFYRNDLGHISIFWGDKRLGLCHIVNNRQKQGVDVENFLKALSFVIENGKHTYNRNKDRHELKLGRKVAIIDYSEAVGGGKFLLTAFVSDV